ncbi:MAG TPA: M14 family zinc carboxypeptidase, partial [Phycisphaerales bacterium]|nr:M14 family zinc carboxypeptidase [Phycisphaerales bacterium]
RYDNWKFVQVEVRSAKDLLALQQIGESMACRPGPGAQIYLIPPDGMGALDALGIPHQIVSENVQDVLDAEDAARAAARAERGGDFFADYHPPTEIDAYMTTLTALRPDLVTPITLSPNTWQGRTIRGVKIAAPPVVGEPARPVIIVNAGQHAREWISVSSAMWAMDQLIRNFDTDSEIHDLVSKVTWIIIPSMNRDGYQYTFDTNRLWRKNRRNNGGGTFGVDNNRNWGYQWGGASTSTSGSSDIYRGPSAFSEPENQALRDFILATPNVKGVIDLHSYAQLILGVWAYSEAVVPPRETELRIVGQEIEDALTSPFGTNYQYGLGTDNLLYEASGVLPDWTFFANGAVSWTWELRDMGTFGFELPAAQIVPTGQEVFNGLKTLARAILMKLRVNVINPPTVVNTGSSIPLNVQVTEVNGNTMLAGSAKLFWRIGNSGPFNEIALSGTFPNFTASLPGTIPCGSNVQYYAQAAASDGTLVNIPADAPASTLAVGVRDFSTVLNDTLESGGTGWSAGMAGDTATTGAWTLVNPNGTTAAPEDDHTPGSGTMCFVTGQGPVGGALGAADVDNGFTTLRTPRFDLSGASSATISYWRWFSNAAGDDSFKVDISNNDGSTWSSVEIVGPAGAGTTGGWIQHSFDAGAILPLTANMRMRFIAADSGVQEVVEAGIDDFVVTAVAPCPVTPACPGDANGDHAVGLADIALVIQTWGQSVTPGAGADLDGNGSIGLGDIAAIIQNWAGACP